MNILVIDDQEEIRNLIMDILRDKGHSVMAAENGKKGIDLLAVYSFDCIITDIVMPEIEGVEFILRLRQSKIPIISLSGLSKEEFIAQLLSSLGIEAYLQKPVTNDEILKSVELVEKRTIQRKGMNKNNLK